MAETVDTRGLYPPILRTPYGLIRPDKSGMGLLVFEQNSPGEGREDDRLPLNRIIVDYTLLNARDDFPYGTVALCPDLGQFGSTWRYPGALPWIPDQDFWLALLQGAVAAPVNVITGVSFVTGFNGFGPALVPPFPFLAPVGRRLHLTGDILAPGTATNAAHTQLKIGGVTVLDAQWTNATVAQHFEIDVWVSAANQVTTSATIVYVVASPPESIVETAADFAIPNLATAAQGIQIGIYDPSTTPSGLYKVTNFGIRCTA